MRIAIVGAGGVGGYFGGRLAQKDPQNTFFVVRGATLAAMRSTGLRVDSVNGNFTIDRPNATDNPSSIGTVDAVLLTVKTSNLDDALESIKPIVGPETIVVPLENGIEAPDDIAQAVRDVIVVGQAMGRIEQPRQP